MGEGSKRRARSKNDGRLQIVYRPTGALRPDPENARVHSPAQVTQLADLMRRNGVWSAIVIDEHNVIVAGHARQMAAEKAGLDEVPCIVLAGLTKTQRRAIALADNKMALNSSWDTELLRFALESAKAEGEDPARYGFEPGELDKLLANESPLTVRRIDVAEVADRFWINVRGPLAQQAKALKRLREFMAELPDVEVEQGTIAEQ